MNSITRLLNNHSALYCCPVGYRPVILMHGILDNYESLDQLVTFIQDAHPGTTVYNIDAYNDFVGLAAASLSQT